MSELHEGELVLEWKPTGRNTATVTARIGNTLLELDTFDLTKSSSRERFAEAICRNRPGISRGAVETQLLQMADESANAAVDTAGQIGETEIDTCALIRPEQFHTPLVSGFAIPKMTMVGNEMVGRWDWYVRRKDGERLMLPLAKKLDLPGGGFLLSPLDPGQPSMEFGGKAGWTSSSRKEWMEGKEAPNLADVFRDICIAISHFLELPEAEGPGITSTLALWVILSYVYSAWPAVPYLFVTGPAGSGKTCLFELLTRLVFRPLVSSSMTAAAMFRTLHTRGGVLLRDEAERLRDNNPEIGEQCAMLLAGYKRGGVATRLEPMADGRFQTSEFQVYGPKALACITGLPPALATRAIPIVMFRAMPGSKKPMLRMDANPKLWQTLQDSLHVVALENGPRWPELVTYTDVCPSMSGRDFELWQPLLAIAALVEEAGAVGLLKSMQAYALASIESAKDDHTPEADEVLLRQLACAVRMGSRPTAGELLEQAKAIDSFGFKTWSPKGVAARLKRYGIRTSKTGGRKCYGTTTLSDLQRIERSYGMDLGTPVA